jgi:hypothetical protein
MRFVTLLASTLGAALALSSAATAQTRDYRRDFMAVTSWSGTFTYTNQGSGQVTIDQFGDTESWSISETVTGSFTLVCKGTAISNCDCPPGPNGGCSSGNVINNTINDSFVEPKGSSPAVYSVVGGAPYIPRNASISYDFDSNTYSLFIDSVVKDGQYLADGRVESTGIQWGCGIALTAPIPFPLSGNTLTYTSGPLQGGPCALLDLPGTLNQNASTAQITLTLTPTYDLDLLVSIPQYDTWRPSANRTEKDPGLDETGNLLTIQATLFNKVTQFFAPVGPTKLTFKLLKISQEKGVAMNWPPADQATNDPDMSFENNLCIPQAGCFPINQGFDVSDPATAVYQSPPAPIEFVQLTSHDWGGTAIVNVDAVVAGITFHGHLQLPAPAISPANLTDIPLPQRQTGSMIADVWKKNHGIPLDTPDDDDSESTPNGDGKPGDGFTLYEEYRGFYMGCNSNPTFPPVPEDSQGAICQHVEGDPNVKDLFVVQLVAGTQGILQFQNASKLKVHFLGLECEEIGGTLDRENQQCAKKDPSVYRVMNVNHTNGPHEVDQHGLVFIQGASDKFSVTVNTDDFNCPQPPVPHSCRPGLPREIDHMELEVNLTPELVKKHVSHEIGHSVNIHHHGDIDGEEFWTLEDGRGLVAYPISNKTLFGTGTPFSLFPEIGGLQIPILPTNPNLRANRVDPNNPVDGTGSPRPGRTVFVGNKVCGTQVVMNGQHSGAQESFMRYATAEAYVLSGNPEIRILTSGEPIGTTLDSDPKGTGVNAKSREPWPRYGDSFTGRGNDLSQIDVNDAHDAQPQNFPDQTCASAGVVQ